MRKSCQKWIGLILLVLCLAGGRVCAEEQLESYMEELDLQSIQKSVDEILPEEKLQIKELLLQLCTGKVSISADTFLEIAENTIFLELKEQRTNIARILILAVTASVFSAFCSAFGKNGVQEIAFYMVYLLLFTLLLENYRELGETSQKTMKEILQFMKLLLPVYLLASSLSFSQTAAIGFYEVTLFILTMVQSLIQYVIMPGIHGYILIAMLNNISREEYLSNMMIFWKKGISWLLKSLLGLVIGIQTIQRMLFPALDNLKNSVWIKAGGAIPVVGNTLSSVTEMFLGTASILKNAVGVMGMLILLYICIRPVLKLLLVMMVYKMIGAVIQPVTDRRFADGMDHMADAVALLLMAVAVTGVVFFLSIAIVTTAGSG